MNSQMMTMICSMKLGEEDSPDEEYDLDWEDIAFLGGMSEEIAEEERERRRLEWKNKKRKSGDDA